MKTSTDPRHKKRIQKIQSLFAHSFHGGGDKSVAEIILELPSIDQAIAEAAPEWPLDKINRIDLAIVRLGVYELLFGKDVPHKVAIDEAVEIAKSYGGGSSPGFVNGVLGTILKKKGQS